MVPSFDEQLKSIRETYAKDYESKITRGIEELDEMKKDLACRQQLHETQQVRDLRRDLKRMELVTIEAHNAA